MRWRALLAGLVAGLLFFAWYFAARRPLIHDSRSEWMPLAFSPDGSTLAAIKASEQHQSWPMGRPRGPIHFVRATDLMETEQPIQLPNVDWGTGFQPTAVEIEYVQFSPDGQTIAVLHQHRDREKHPGMELTLIARSSRAVERTFEVQNWRQNQRDAIPRNLFSKNGRFLVYFESRLDQPHNVVRIWDRPEQRECLTAEKVQFPILSPNSRWLAVIGEDLKSLQLYDIQSANQIHKLTLAGRSTGTRQFPEFSADSSLVAVYSLSHPTPTTQVFEAESGRQVYDIDSWSPLFLDDGRTFVTVRYDRTKSEQYVVFRDVADWKLRARTPFRLGTHWASGDAIAPEPVAVPHQSAVIVYDYYPDVNVTFMAIARKLGFDFGMGHGATWVDAKSGNATRFQLTDSVGSGSVMSPDGSRLAVTGLVSGLTIWELPPRRSWLGVAYAAALMSVTALVVVAIRRVTCKRAVDPTT